MKEKRTYSLTARERKQRRHGEVEKSAPAVDQQTQVASEEQAMVVAQKKSKRSAIIAASIASVAVVLILVALIVPIFAYIANPYREYDFVVARFDLSNEMKLEFQIETDDYEIATTNFIFLAKNGYFDNTVFFDAGYKDEYNDLAGWLRFGGYEEQPNVWEGDSNVYDTTHHHSQNEAFCEAFSAIPNDRFRSPLYKFGYELYSDSGANIGKRGDDAEALRDKGILAFLYNDTSTEFQISYTESAPETAVEISSGKTKTVDLKSTRVGKALNDETIKNLETIAATRKNSTGISAGILWAPPDPTIRIKNIKLYNLGEEWETFDFMEFVLKSNENGARMKNWSGRA